MYVVILGTANAVSDLIWLRSGSENLRLITNPSVLGDVPPVSVYRLPDGASVRLLLSVILIAFSLSTSTTSLNVSDMYPVSRSILKLVSEGLIESPVNEDTSNALVLL